MATIKTVKRKKPIFNATEGKILRYLYFTKVERNASQIAKKVGITYPTSKKYLEGLTKRQVLKSRKVIPKRKLVNVTKETLYKFNFDSFKKT